MVRVLIAGVLGGIAMFVWTSVAHMATPLATMGVQIIPSEETVLGPLHAALGDKPGFYFFPGVDQSDPNGMTAYEEKAKTMPWGIMIYHPPGGEAGMTPAKLIVEFVKELAQTLIAAFLLSLSVLGAYLARVGFVALISVSAALSTNVSYFVFYGFPLDYTLGYITIDIVGGIVAGLVIAAILKPHTA